MNSENGPKPIVCQPYIEKLLFIRRLFTQVKGNLLYFIERLTTLLKGYLKMTYFSIREMFIVFVLFLKKDLLGSGAQAWPRPRPE